MALDEIQPLGFRGKDYASFFERVTGKDIYVNLSNAEVLEVAAILEDHARAASEFARMFRAYGEAGYQLLASDC